MINQGNSTINISTLGINSWNKAFFFSLRAREAASQRIAVSVAGAIGERRCGSKFPLSISTLWTGGLCSSVVSGTTKVLPGRNYEGDVSRLQDLEEWMNVLLHLLWFFAVLFCCYIFFRYRERTGTNLNLPLLTSLCTKMSLTCVTIFMLAQYRTGLLTYHYLAFMRNKINRLDLLISYVNDKRNVIFAYWKKTTFSVSWWSGRFYNNIPAVYWVFWLVKMIYGCSDGGMICQYREYRIVCWLMHVTV